MTFPSGIVLDELLDDLQQLIECESPSSDHAAVARSADLLAQLGFKRFNASPERIVLDGVHHLRWRFGAAPRVLVLAHHDTVWPLGTLARKPFAITDGVLTGPGCFDMLSGLVMAMHAIASLPSKDGVTLLVTGDEELGSLSSRTLIEDEARLHQAAFVLEASADGGAIKTQRKGVSLYEIEVVGRAAHAGLEPEKGINATVAQAHLVLAAAQLGDLEAGTSVTPTSATSGTTSNTVPATSSFAIDVRAWTVGEQERVDAAIRALAAGVDGAKVIVHGGINRPPLEAISSQALFAKATELARESGHPALTGAAVGGASDGNFTAGVGTPTLDGLGAVGGGAHAESEHLLVDRLVDRTELLQALLVDQLQVEAR